MSEELGELHRVHAAAPLGRERMPEEVRVLPCDRGAVGRATEELEDAAGCQRRVLAEGVAPRREEDPVAPGVRWPDALMALREWSGRRDSNSRHPAWKASALTS